MIINTLIDIRNVLLWDVSDADGCLIFVGYSVRDHLKVKLHYSEMDYDSDATIPLPTPAAYLRYANQCLRFTDSKRKYGANEIWLICRFIIIASL